MRKILLFGFLFISLVGNSQTLPSIQTIKTPEAGAIDKVIETPVSYSTGTPNISIPLYEIQIKGVTVPITLNYTSGGIRTDEEATWVGLGWSLSYGGQISRTVEGKPDEYVFFNAGTNSSWSNYSIANFLTLPGISQDCYMTDRVTDIYEAKSPTMLGDYMPDEFYYSALGHSGRFMFNQEQAKFVFFPKDDIKVNYTYSSSYQTFSGENNYYPIEYWNMLMPDGTSIVFGNDGTSSSGSYLSGPGAYVTNAWMVKSIQNRFNESINYTYNPFSYSLYKLSGQTYSYDAQTISTNIVNYGYNDANIKTITFPSGSIQFITATRQDLPTQALSEIDIFNNSGRLVRKIDFKYNYFVGSDGDINTVTSDESVANTGALETYRLRLDSLVISNANVQPLTYTFSYNTPSVLPSKNSVDQDFWGFYNGPKNNSTLIPLMFNNQIQYGERLVDSNYNNAFSLHTIKYPTGGTTEFVYEGNTVSSLNIPLYLQQDLQSEGQTQTYQTGGGDLEIDCFGRTNSYSPSAPDSVGPFGERYFWSSFAVPPQGGVAPTGYNWQCRTDFVRNVTKDNSRDCNSLNVEFLLQQLTSSGYTTVKTFFARNCSSNTWVGSDNESVSLLNNTMDTIQYRMSVVLWYPVQSYNPIVYATEPDPVDTNYFNQTLFNLFILNPLPPTPPGTPAPNTKVGGLRIKTISNYNSDGGLAQKRAFSYNQNGSTTGQLLTIPTLYENVETTSPGYSTDVKIFSNSFIPLQTNAGSYLVYTNVKENLIDSVHSDTLITQYAFSFNPAQNDPIYGYWKQGILDPEEWNRCQLQSVNYLKHDSLLKTENYTYYSYSPNLAPSYSDTTTINLNEDYVDEINTNFISYAVLRPTASTSQAANDFFDVAQLNYPGFPPNTFNNIYWFYSVASVYLPDDAVNCPNSIFDNIYSNVYTAYPTYHQTLPYFKRYTGFAKPKSKSTTTYDNYGNSITETENYFYDETPALYQITRTQKTSSKGDLFQFQASYPNDSSTSVPYSSMVYRNMVNYPIAQTETKNGNFLQSTTTNYANWTDSIIAPVNVLTKIGNHPADQRFQYYSYDSIGNILSESKSADAITSFIYDYKKQYPVAAVTNAIPSDIAYTSFESDGTGNWVIGSGTIDTTTSITGSNSFNMSGVISCTGLNSSTTYLVSYWTTNSGPLSVGGTISGYPLQGKTEYINNNNWTLFVHKVSGLTSITVSGSGHIDELRLYPAAAQMTTYTYMPMVGITSQADIGNRVTYFEYDGLSRLKRIRDQDYNILKTFDYQYQAPSGCGSGCTILAMQTFVGTNTPGYPVGVFDVHGNLLGNATGASGYVSLWNNDTADTRFGTLSAGSDSLHFNLAVNSGKTAPPGVTGCRYYQYDLPWAEIDGITLNNGTYVDFGDGSGMHLPTTDSIGDTVAYRLAPNTTRLGFFSQFDGIYWFIHHYPDSSLKTITLYHNENAFYTGLDNATDPATSLTEVRNLRGNFPQSIQSIGGSCYQQSSALTVANVSNWTSISSVTSWWAHCGDHVTPSLNLNYAQDFMAGNRNLQIINTTNLGYYQSGYWDSAFKLTRLKSNWNAYFMNLQDIEICDAHWNREDLTALTNLSKFCLLPDNQNHSNNSTGNPNIPIPASAISNILIQIANGAGQNVSNGVIWILTGGGTGRDSTSNSAVSALDSKGWQIYIDNVQQ